MDAQIKPRGKSTSCIHRHRGNQGISQAEGSKRQLKLIKTITGVAKLKIGHKRQKIHKIK